MPRQAKPDKPLYRVPSMIEVAALPWNGFTVASTFSGCGGSCLGYRITGRVVWANRLVRGAGLISRKHEQQHDVQLPRHPPDPARRGREGDGGAAGELDLLDGSPPCQAFSTSRRPRGLGLESQHGASQCNETLFDEYIRLLRGLNPKTFVAENVSGLVKGTAKGWFIEVLRALKACGISGKCPAARCAVARRAADAPADHFRQGSRGPAPGPGPPGTAPIPLLGAGRAAHT